MNTIKSLFLIASIVSVCMAQNINISGVVKDNAGAAIEGASVKLENAGITTTTLADGSFTLSGITANIHYKNPGQLSDRKIFTLSNGQLHFSLKAHSVVKLDIYNIRGSIIYSLRKAISEGPHSFTLPGSVTGINIYKVKIGNIEHIFKIAVAGQISNISSVVNENTGVLSKQAKTTGVIEDVIVVTKTGYLTYRMNVKNSDTSGVEIIMEPGSKAGSTVTDIDGNVYNTVIIGNQEWTVENLRVTSYNDGKPIPHSKGKSAWKKNSSPGYCFYENNSSPNAEKYGALYSWHVVGTKKLSPTGWHVPTDAEWTELEEYLIANGYNWDGTTSGNKTAKSLASQADWDPSTVLGAIGNDLSKNNASGFSALPGGYIADYGDLYNIAISGHWWSATENTAGNPWRRYLGYGSSSLRRSDDFNKRTGLSVRLLRD